MLTKDQSVAKLSKIQDFPKIAAKWESYILYLAPARTARIYTNLCPGSTRGCRLACLFTAGRGKYRSVTKARLQKTILLLDQPHKFMERLESQIDSICRNTTKQVAIRLNGTSDLNWGDTGVMYNFPEVQFYDYTKVPHYYKNRPDNWHLTFSVSEYNERSAKIMLRQGYNVAVVSTSKPKLLWHNKTIDGDAHDLRFLDPSPRVVLLSPKGAAKQDTTGFVRRNL